MLFGSIASKRHLSPDRLWEQTKPLSTWGYAARPSLNWLKRGESHTSEPGANTSFSKRTLSAVSDRGGYRIRKIAPGGAIMTGVKSPLRNRLDRLYAIRETAVRLRTEKRGIPGGTLLELIIILPDVVEDLIQEIKQIERMGADGGNRKN
jgi:hypothetical protein